MTDCPLLHEIRTQAAGNLPLQRALVAGAVMEGGSLCGPWVRGDGGCAAGPFQIHWWKNPCDRDAFWQGHPISAEEAEDPAQAVAYAIDPLGLNYQGNAAVHPNVIDVVYLSERPQYYYSDQQQRAAFAVLDEVFGSAGATGMVAKPDITFIPAAAGNINPRPNVVYEALVIHTTAGGRTIADLGRWFGGENLRQGLQGSTHFGVDLDGRIGQFVELSEQPIAHGAEVGSTLWLVRENPNLSANAWAIGIEHLDGGVAGVVTSAQLDASAHLMAWLWQEHIAPFAAQTGAALDREHIILHRELAPRSKPFCPSWPEARVLEHIERMKDYLNGEQPVEPPPGTRIQDLLDVLTVNEQAWRESAAAATIRADNLRAVIEAHR